MTCPRYLSQPVVGLGWNLRLLPDALSGRTSVSLSLPADGMVIINNESQNAPLLLWVYLEKIYGAPVVCQTLGTQK